MMPRLAFVFLCAFAVTAEGATPPPTPPEVPLKLKWKTTKVTQVPKGVDPTCGGMMPEPEENPDATVQIAEVDLDSDGSPELFVDYPAGGSGGGYSMLYRRRKGIWSQIAFLQGGITFRHPYRGYLRISMGTRGGGGHFATGFLRFERGEYRTYRIDHYEMGEYKETEYPKE